MAVRVHCTSRQLESGLRGAGVPVQPAGSLLEFHGLWSLSSQVQFSSAVLGLLDVGEDAVGLGAPIRAAGKRCRALRTEQALIGEVGHPGLAFGRALRRPRREADLAHGFGYLTNLFAAAPAMFDHPLKEVGALLLPVDAGIGFLERAVGP